MTHRDVKKLLNNYSGIREVVSIAKDYNIECEKHALLLVEIVNAICNSEDIKCICFKKHHVDKLPYLQIAVEEGLATATAHFWVETLERQIALAMSSVKGTEEWLKRHFPEIYNDRSEIFPD